MRNLLFIFVFMVLCSGCILISDAKYQADEAMWTAKAEASKAWAQQSNRPLASFTAISGETFVVNNPNQAQPIAVTGQPNAIVQGADVILNSGVAKILGGGWAAGYMLGKVQGNYNASGDGSINVTRDSGNTVDVETRHVEDGGTISNVPILILIIRRLLIAMTIILLLDDHSIIDDNSDNRSEYGNIAVTPIIESD